MRWKWVLIGVVGVILAVVVVAYILVVNYDFNALKPQLAQAVKERTGRELVLGGNIDVKLGLIPAFVVENVSFQNAPWGSRPELARVKRLEMQVALLPLFRREIALQRLLLVQPDILIETDTSGRSNLNFATGTIAAPAEPGKTPPQEEARLPLLLVNRVRIEQGRLTYKDGQTGKTHVVDLEKLQATGSGPGKPITLTLQGAYNTQSFEAEGTFGPLAALASPSIPWPLTMRVTAGGATVAVDGSMQDVLHARGLAMHITAQGASLPAVVKLVGGNDVPEVGPFQVSFTVADSGGTLEVQQLKAEVGSEELVRLRLSGVMKNVQAQQGMDLHFTVQGKDLQSMQTLVNAPLAMQGPFEVSGRVTDSGRLAYQVADLQAVLPHLDLSGTGEVRLAGARPQFTARLSSEKIDLRPFLAPVAQPQPTRTTSPAATKDKIFPQEPVSLHGLQRVDATLELRARQLLTPRLALDDFTLHVVLQDGLLTGKPIQARMGGGSLDGSVKLQPVGQAAQVTLAVTMHKVDVGRMARALQVTDILDGKFDATVDVQGRGDSIAAIMAGLYGQTSVVLGKSRLDNAYVELIGADLGASLFRLVNPLQQEQQMTEINCLVSRFDIKDGMAQSSALVFDTQNMSVVGEGQINLKTEALDLSFKPAPKEGAGVSSLGKVGLNLSELAKPLKLGGTLAHPSLTIDATQVALTVGKSIGGVVLFGPVGIVTALVSGSSAEEENSCLKALETAKSGVKSKEAKPLEEVKDALEKATEGIGTGLKKLFGK